MEEVGFSFYMLLYSLNSCATSKFYFCIVKKRIKKEKNFITNSFRIICNLEKSFHSLVSQVVQCRASLIIRLYSMSKSQHDYLNSLFSCYSKLYIYRDKNPLSLEDLMLSIQGASYMQGSAHGEEKPGT